MLPYTPKQRMRANAFLHANNLIDPNGTPRDRTINQVASLVQMAEETARMMRSVQKGTFLPGGSRNDEDRLAAFGARLQSVTLNIAALLDYAPMWPLYDHMARDLIRGLPDIALQYAAHPDREDARGFAAIHDLCDANDLLHCTLYNYGCGEMPPEGISGHDDWIEMANGLSELVTDVLISAWNYPGKPDPFTSREDVDMEEAREATLNYEDINERW